MHPSTLTPNVSGSRRRCTCPQIRIYVDKASVGPTVPGPDRLREALAACRAGGQLVVAKLDRLARSVSDAHDIARN